MKMMIFLLAFFTMIFLLVYSFFLRDIIMSKLLIGISLIIGLLIVKKFKLKGFDN